MSDDVESGNQDKVGQVGSFTSYYKEPTISPNLTGFISIYLDVVVMELCPINTDTDLMSKPFCIRLMSLSHWMNGGIKVSMEQSAR